MPHGGPSTRGHGGLTSYQSCFTILTSIEVDDNDNIGTCCTVNDGLGPCSTINDGQGNGIGVFCKWPPRFKFN